jgi:hypothetical protein
MIGTIDTTRVARSPQPERASRSLEFGVYRDGDNNLDDVQALVIGQALQTSKKDGSIEFTIEDTTSRRGFEPEHVLRTESYTIADGGFASDVKVGPPHDMSARGDLAKFVAHVLDNAQRANAKATWIDLVDHGGGDGGGLQSEHSATGIMRADDIAGAIADGVEQHARAHPEDAGRGVDGVVANQCLMGTLAFGSALSDAGVKFLAASPETMLAPGVPTSVAHDIAAHLDDPAKMAKAVVATTMNQSYGPKGEGFAPAAAFDVFDLDPAKMRAVRDTVTTLDAALVDAAGHRSERAAIREDARAIHGMVRFPEGKSLPWRADRPAIALYDTFSQDGRLSPSVREAATKARDAISDTVLAHRESDGFEPFDGSDYSDAAGPTVHFPVTPKQIDGWAPQISETDNAFYKGVGASDLARVVA